MPPKRKSDTTFKVGERVLARWAGSKKFYDGKIVDVLKSICKVQFDNDGSISSVKLADIKKPEKSIEEVSPKTTRSKTRSRSRSLGRSSRSTSRSPARKAKSKNERKSSDRKSSERKSSDRKSSERKSSDRKISERTGASTTNTNSLSKDEVDTVKKPILTREKISLDFSPSVKLNSVLSKDVKLFMSKEETISERVRSTKRLSALRSMETTQRLLDSKQDKGLISDKQKYSDDDEEEEDEKHEKKLPPKSLSKLWLSLYFFGTSLKIVGIPLFLLFLIFACTAKQCTILEMPQFFSRWIVFVNNIKIPLSGVTVFHTLMLLLPLIPLGKKVSGFSTADSKTPMEYRIHGLIYMIASSIIFGACTYFGVNMNFGYDKFKPIALSLFIYCAVFALVMHTFFAFKGERSVHSKVPLLGNFYDGYFVNPTLFGKFDVKTSFIRAGFIGSVLLNFSILTKYILVKNIRGIIPLGLTAGMQIFFALDLLFREEKLLSTALYTSDSVGYAFIIAFGFLIPVSLSFQNVFHYAYETKLDLSPAWFYSIVAGIVLLFCFGYYIYVTSSNLKHNFRRNPYDKAVLKYDSIPTQIKAKRLLVSGGWGLVRHPNYLGLLIMAIAWTLPCGYTHAAPYGPLVMYTIFLVLRVLSIEKGCEEKYGPGWKTYTEKVRSRLIPYVF